MDAIFKALNDPARRTLMDSLRARDGQTLTDLDEQLDMTRFGVMKHLKVLEDAHLVTTRKVGRFKYHYLNPLPLQDLVDRWIDPFLQPQAQALSALKRRLETTKMKPDFVMTTYIRCTPEALWHALRDPTAVQHYDFLGQTAERDGDTLIYSTPDGTVTLHCTELEAEPMTRLVTSFEPKWEDGVKTSRVVYLIEQQGDYCRLTVEHHDLQHDPEGGTADGWERTLAGLKTWLETGQPFAFGGDHLWAEGT
ncbi:MAG: transcriptional regulator, ArsR family [Rhodobacteraceae bacterium HLUCCA08]|nr:MAG: transcriptional regulator, ArsR family [Rhodobacteraceae bacterium HLUCCA08]